MDYLKAKIKQSPEIMRERDLEDRSMRSVRNTVLGVPEGGKGTEEGERIKSLLFFTFRPLYL